MVSIHNYSHPIYNFQSICAALLFVNNKKSPRELNYDSHYYVTNILYANASSSCFSSSGWYTGLLLILLHRLFIVWTDQCNWVDHLTAGQTYPHGQIRTKCDCVAVYWVNKRETSRRIEGILHEFNNYELQIDSLFCTRIEGALCKK